jgi:hypothetical protein
MSERDGPLVTLQMWALGCNDLDHLVAVKQWQNRGINAKFSSNEQEGVC